MSVKIRLKITGKKDRSSFRVVAVDESKKRNGKVIATLGFFDKKNPNTVKLDKKNVLMWLSRGAKFSDAVSQILEIEHGRIP